MYRIRPSAKFERSLEDLIRARYRRNPQAERALRALVEKALAKLAAQGRLPGAYPEPWPAGSFREGWELWKHHFSMPGLRGAAGEGRLIYALAPEAGEVVPAWVYTHAEFRKHPPEDALRALFAEATQAGK